MSETDFECADGTTVGALRGDLAGRYGERAGFGSTLLVSVNWDPADPERVLAEGDEVAFLPPMSGGAGPGGAFWISETPITPVVVGDSDLAGQLSQRLLDQGVFAQAVVFPTVALDRARIRTIVTSEHSRDELQTCLDAFATAGRDLRII